MVFLWWRPVVGCFFIKMRPFGPFENHLINIFICLKPLKNRFFGFFGAKNGLKQAENAGFLRFLAVFAIFFGVFYRLNYT